MKVLKTYTIQGRNIYCDGRIKLMSALIEFTPAAYGESYTGYDLLRSLELKYPLLFKNAPFESIPDSCARDFYLFNGHLIAQTINYLQKSNTFPPLIKKYGSTTGGLKIKMLFEYRSKRAAEIAVSAAISIMDALVTAKTYNYERDQRKIEALLDKRDNSHLIKVLTDEATLQKLPSFHWERSQIIQFGLGANQKRLQSSFTNRTSYIGVKLSGNKEQTKNVLKTFGIPVPAGKLIFNQQELSEAIEITGYPLVVKPLSRNHGKGISLPVEKYEDAVSAYNYARSFSGQRGVIVEQYIVGNDYRVLVINHKFVAAAKRTPPVIYGDGKSSVLELINGLNNDPRRGEGHSNPLSIVRIDRETEMILQLHHLTANSVLELHEELFLKNIANISAGGLSEDVTDLVHAQTIFEMERVSRLVDLDICGIDVISRDIGEPIGSGSGSVIEVNAAPGFRLHTHPAKGIARNVAEPVFQMLFPQGTSALIPVISVSMGVDSGLLCQDLDNLLRGAGFTTGRLSAKGLFINNWHNSNLEKSSRNKKINRLFKDPMIDMAIVECLPEQIIRIGVGFDDSDLVIIADSGLTTSGLSGKDKQIFRALLALISTLPATGHLILNADEIAYADLAAAAICEVIYISINRGNPMITRHIQNGGRAAVIGEEDMVFFERTGKQRSIILPGNLTGMKTPDECIRRRLVCTFVTGMIYNAALNPGAFNSTGHL